MDFWFFFKSTLPALNAWKTTEKLEAECKQKSFRIWFINLDKLKTWVFDWNITLTVKLSEWLPLQVCMFKTE